MLNSTLGYGLLLIHIINKDGYDYSKTPKQKKENKGKFDGTITKTIHKSYAQLMRCRDEDAKVGIYGRNIRRWKFEN